MRWLQTRVDEAESYKNSIGELSRIAEALSPLLSQTGSERLEQDQRSLETALQTVISDAIEKQSMLSETYEQRKELMRRIDEIEKRLKEKQGGIEVVKDIYLDEADVVLDEFRVGF